MNSKGRATENAFIEWLWRSLKYGCVYLNAFSDVGELFRVIDAYYVFYKYGRPHQSLGDATIGQI